MVKANTVGKRDGRIACWLDGELVADFPNLRLRDVDTLKIDRFAISLHIGSNTAGRDQEVVRQRGGGDLLHRPGVHEVGRRCRRDYARARALLKPHARRVKLAGGNHKVRM